MQNFFYSFSKSLMVRFWQAILVSGLGLVLWSCNLGQNPNSVQTASFKSLYDSIAAYDSAVIIFETEDGRLIDTVFNNHFVSRADFQNLVVDGWDGGKAIILITAYQGGVAVYGVEKHFDGTTDVTEGTFIVVQSGASISSTIREFRMIEGDSLVLPGIKIMPETLSDKTLIWSSDHPDIVLVGTTYLKALKDGSALVTVKLQSDLTKSLSFNVTVSVNSKMPESIRLSMDTLYLAAGGASGQLSLTASPSTASNAVYWSTDDLATATVTPDGIVTGLKMGATLLHVVSKLKPTITDFAWVVVSPRVDVLSVRFLKDSTDLFMGGAAEDLQVEVLPILSNPSVQFSVLDSRIVRVKDGRITPLADGSTSVIVKSQENPLLLDTLKVNVHSSQNVDSVNISKPMVNFISPQTSGNVLTRSSALDIKGRASALSPGSIKAVTYTTDGVAGSLPTNLAGDGSWSIKALPLVNNTTIILKVTATDQIGNTGEASLSLSMDNTSPSAPTFSGLPPALVLKGSSTTNLSWSWTKTGATTDSFVVKLNGSEVSRQTTTSYSFNISNDGSFQLEVAEVDLAGNLSGFVKSTVTLVDRISPNPPNLKKPDSPAKTVQWTWTTGNGGNGNYECQLDNGTVSDCASNSKYDLSPITQGEHTLSVREKDDAGNVSDWSTQTATIDLTDPTISRSNYLNTQSQIFNKIEAFTGSAGDNLPGAKVFYKVGNGAEQAVSGLLNWSFTPALSKGTQTINIRVEDAAKNSVSVSVQVTYLPDVVFIRSNADGLNNGSSWANAYTDLNSIYTPGKTFSSSSPQFWVSKGTYSANQVDGFGLIPNSSLFGGFRNDGTDSALANRDVANNVTLLKPNEFSKSVITNTWISSDNNSHTTEVFFIGDVTLDEGRFGFGISNAKKATLKNITIKNWLYANWGINVSNSAVDISDSHFENNHFGDGPVYMRDGGTIRINNTIIRGNNMGDGGGLAIYGGSVCASQNTILRDNTNVNIFIVSAGAFTYESNVDLDLSKIQYDVDPPLATIGSCPAPF